MNVCEALLDIMADYGVKYIFGIPGDAVNELTEAIRKQDRIKFIHVMHEEAGAFAASAQAKLSGSLCACVGTAGPGAIHLLNGLYDAKADQAPLLAITGQVETRFIGSAYQQEVDLHALFHDVTVYNQTILNAEQFTETAILACQTALAQKGVAHLSIPIDISTQKVSHYKEKKQVIRTSPRIVPHMDDLNKAAALIARSAKPCILAGIGARDAVPELLELAKRLQAPIVKALRGKDLLPDNHPYTLGGIGLLGTEPSSYAMKHCDALVVVGSDFPYHDFYPGVAIPTIQIDVRRVNIGRRHPVDVPLIGDTKETLAALLGLIGQKKDASFLNSCQQEMAEWNREQDEDELSREKPIHPQALARKISEEANDDAIIVCDTGAVTVWGARNFKIKGTQQFTLSGGLASMAYGLPAAIGARLYYPGRQVIALCGDGGFAMLMCDFATAVRYKLDIKVFIFNNRKLGLIQMEEEGHAGNPEYETGLHNIDYAAFANACGGRGFFIREPEDLDRIIPLALSEAVPCIVDVCINPGELTIPPEITASEAFNYLKAKLTEQLIKHSD
jgi:thiamine pyrophosphate-dependent acetolactate synthase large subunit-like protein